jgi:hypothetical protein
MNLDQSQNKAPAGQADCITLTCCGLLLCSLLRWGLPSGTSPSPADEQQLTQLCDSLGCKPSKEARGMWEVKAHLLKQQSSVQPAQVCRCAHQQQVLLWPATMRGVHHPVLPGFSSRRHA